MKILQPGKCAFAVIPLLLFLAGCAGAPQETRTEPGVEEIAPGERTVISAPAGNAPDRSAIEERNI